MEGTRASHAAACISDQLGQQMAHTVVGHSSGSGSSTSWAASPATTVCHKNQLRRLTAGGFGFGVPGAAPPAAAVSAAACLRLSPSRMVSLMAVFTWGGWKGEVGGAYARERKLGARLEGASPRDSGRASKV